ncbi:porin family protein [Coxiella endosymbiont of Amblyomma americanum]|uniref:outer membrane beta-barrel protein n=1 Tax=Coxiella endosymbiont of Amblyomma americanum TaxID=325775 RepID=UPI000580B405|nr:outer membrane beta-barrel protein [Coxiella endosymbiont of Amblyomma americanum]AJC50464.1 membrane protein [Coxiella endosymbiont of Amblyomma americanum]AUJ58805.1 hypothetical protein B1F76_01825 [Coxiella-like endosymbiont of Amblyomma americanum]
MLVKKLITFVTASIASVGVTSAAVAGGPDYVSTPAGGEYSGIYIEGNAGYVYHPWGSDVTTVPGILKNFSLISSSSRGDGGSTFGGDLGYQFNKNIALEGGWFYLPKATFNTVDPGSFAIKGGVAYTALKGMASIYGNTYAFGKLGVSYTYNWSSIALASSDLNSTNNVSSCSNYWNPLFAAGMQYYLTPNWSVSTQYVFVPGYRSASSNRFVTPVVHLLTMNVGYKFVI